MIIMSKFIKTILITLTLILGLVGLSGISYAASPAPPPTQSSTNQACQGLSQLGGVNCSSKSGKTAVGNLAQTVVSILAKIVGIVSVAMIIFAGFRYVTAGGDSNSINSARNTLIYAIVGLAIAVIAQLIASDVLNTANGILKK